LAEDREDEAEDWSAATWLWATAVACIFDGIFFGLLFLGDGASWRHFAVGFVVGVIFAAIAFPIFVRRQQGKSGGPFDGLPRRGSRRERELRVEMEERVRHYKETGEWRP
jgi:hypothetical protein